MPFGLTNAPATFQQFVNDVLREFLDIFLVVYVDDMLIYSEDLAQHDNCVRKVLEKLKEYGLFCKPEKCEFGVSSTTFLGFVISKHGLSMDTSKIQTIRDWKPPINVRGVQSFLGFANFYRRFISRYSELAAPLFALTRKETKYQWSQACQSAFDKLKIAFTSEPILRHFNATLSTVLKTDASDKVISAVLSQYHSDSVKRLHPVAHFSRTMTSAEINYTVGDKELLAIVESLKEYRQYVCNLSTPVRIITDHQNLTAFTTKRILNRRQARWALEPAEIDFCLEFRPGLKNSRADALTRQAEHINVKERFEAPHDLIVTPGKIISKETSSTVINSSLFCFSREIGEDDPILDLENSFAKEVADSLNSDLFGQEIIHALKSSLSHHPRVDLGSCKISSQGLATYLGENICTGISAYQGHLNLARSPSCRSSGKS
ncbi:hypothetical protein K3495_g6174 [Podosphaera aphanis]|nr:hypothetical protein K3495_g6174 [Podosphaera aphanis]